MVQREGEVRLLEREAPVDRMLAPLKRPQGAQIGEMAAATGWSVELVRSALAMVMRRKGRVSVRSHCERRCAGLRPQPGAGAVSAIQPATADVDVADEVRALAGLDLEALRAVWRARIGPPPGMRSHDHLRRLLAWRLQADVLGGLDADTRHALSSRARGVSKLAVGVRLSREWRGRLISVEIGEEGVLYAGHAYRSLSEVARVVTGVRWNEPRFFGLRGEAA